MNRNSSLSLAALLLMPLAVCMACAAAAEPPGDKQAWIVDLGWYVVAKPNGSMSIRDRSGM
ncbi:MAG TPA: hypothetical protein VGP72_09445 [Planctomycetota bacterium]|jgi:hypothetical protein